MYAGQVEIVLEFKIYLWPSQTCSDFAVSIVLGMCICVRYKGFSIPQKRDCQMVVGDCTVLTIHFNIPFSVDSYASSHKRILMW